YRVHAAAGIDRSHPLRKHVHLGTADLPIERGQLAVHVRDAHIIHVNQRDLPHPGPRERFDRPRAHSTDSYYTHVSGAQTREPVRAVQAADPAETIRVSLFGFGAHSFVTRVCRYASSPSRVIT